MTQTPLNTGDSAGIGEAAACALAPERTPGRTGRGDAPGNDVGIPCRFPTAADASPDLNVRRERMPVSQSFAGFQGARTE